MRLVSLLMLVFLVGACSPMKASDFAERSPSFTLEEYFLGHTRGHGIFFDRWGRAKTSFVLDVIGRQNGDLFLMQESLAYQNGDKLERLYEIRKTGEHLYEATADGIVGKASIESYGNALHWQYTLRQKIGSREWNLNFDDWMYLQTDKLVLNKARVSKFGLHVGDVVILIEKL